MKSVVKVPVDEKHRIVIPVDMWNALKLQYGDYLNVTITKVKE